MAEKIISKAKECLRKFFKEKMLVLDQVVFYGSQIRQDARPDSDLDIIVVSRSFRGKGIVEKLALVQGIHWELVKQLNQPVDILYYSDKEWKANHSPIAAMAKKEGLAFDVSQI